MDKATFRKFWDDFINDAEEVMFAKMEDYADPKDQLANFKGEAKDLGLTPLQVHGVYFNKHVRAVNAFTRNGKAASEPIRMRFIDILNYAVLGAALAEVTCTSQS